MRLPNTEDQAITLLARKIIRLPIEVAKTLMVNTIKENPTTAKIVVSAWTLAYDSLLSADVTAEFFKSAVYNPVYRKAFPSDMFQVAA